MLCYLMMQKCKKAMNVAKIQNPCQFQSLIMHMSHIWFILYICIVTLRFGFI